ncbi:MAG: hypothetical protein HUU15_09705 [Candidatus Brocadiae bacterium]|nr:hypothetical protein [Candidatus Brocadiia bacterium]
MKSALLCALLSAASFLALAAVSRSAINRESSVPEPPFSPAPAPRVPAAASPEAPPAAVETAAVSLPAAHAEPERLYERHEIRGRESEFEAVFDGDSRPYSRAMHIRYRKKKTTGGP